MKRIGREKRRKGDMTIRQNKGTMKEQRRNLGGTMEGDLKQDSNNIVNKLYNNVFYKIKEHTVIFQTLTNNITFMKSLNIDF